MCATRDKKKLLQSSIQEENDGTAYMNDTRLGDAQREQQPYSHCMERWLELTLIQD